MATRLARLFTYFSVVGLCFVLIFLAIHYKNQYQKTSVLSLFQQTQTVPNIIARVGEYQIGKLTGWASPFAEVNLTGQALARKTTADATGYFLFEQIPVKKNYGELCLISQDVNQLPSSPLCLAPPPPSNNIEIIDVLLPPTISIEGEKINYGKTTKASGMTYPDSLVQVYLFSESAIFPNIKLPKLSFEIVRPVYAIGFPVYNITSNNNGYFEFNLPTINPSTNRIYVSSVFNINSRKNLAEILDQASSPKSFTLTYQIYKNINLLIIILLGVLAVLIFLVISKRKQRSYNLAKLSKEESVEIR